jgi:hypothetical protein
MIVFFICNREIVLSAFGRWVLPQKHGNTEMFLKKSLIFNFVMLPTSNPNS